MIVGFADKIAYSCQYSTRPPTCNVIGLTG